MVLSDKIWRRRDAGFVVVVVVVLFFISFRIEKRPSLPPEFRH